MATEKQLIFLDEALEATHKEVFWTESEAAAIRSFLVKLPKADAVEVVHGRWREKILVGGFAEEWGYVCSECGCTVSDRSNLGIGRYAGNNQRLNYCPNCGARMDGGEDNGL